MIITVVGSLPGFKFMDTVDIFFEFMTRDISFQYEDTSVLSRCKLGELFCFKPANKLCF